MLLLLLGLQLGPPDTLRIRWLDGPPPAESEVDSIHLRPPAVRIPTRQGTAAVWLVRIRDTVHVAASIPDSTPYWGDDFVLSIDTGGDGAASPQHDDFQLYFRRALDSSVVYRGRNGRWEPPRNDPDWRLGSDRAGGGWTVSSTDRHERWNLLLRLDPAWFAGEKGRPARVAFRIYDNDPGGWFAFPTPKGRSPPASVENSPALWIPVR